MTSAPPRPVYVLHGNDSFLRDESRHRIVAEIIGPADPQVCVSSFDADAQLAEVLDELRTLPFLAPCRVVIVRDADAFVSAYRDAIEKYLEAPAHSGTLMLLVSSWPNNTRLYKAVAKVGQAIDCSVPKNHDLPRWIVEAAGRHGKKIDREAAELLADWIGPDLATLDGELEKLSIFVGGRATIAVQDVSALVAVTAGPGAFDLTNAIVAGSAKDALTALGGMLVAKGEEFRALGMIASHLRKSLLAQQLRSTGKSPDAVLPPRIPPDAKNAFLAMLVRRPLRKLQADFRRLLKADLGMKSGADPLGTMQELVVALCS